MAARPARAGDAVVLTGDIHSSWAMDITTDITDASSPSGGVEFVCPSVTSDGFYEIFRGRVPAGTPPEAVVSLITSAAGALKAQNPWVKYVDGVGHGFTVVDVTPARVQADWYLTPVPSTAQPDPRVVQAVVPAYATSWQTLSGSRRVTAATGQLGARSDKPAGPAA